MAYDRVFLCSDNYLSFIFLLSLNNLITDPSKKNKKSHPGKPLLEFVRAAR